MKHTYFYFKTNKLLFLSGLFFCSLEVSAQSSDTSSADFETSLRLSLQEALSKSDLNLAEKKVHIFNRMGYGFNPERSPDLANDQDIIDYIVAQFKTATRRGHSVDNLISKLYPDVFSTAGNTVQSRDDFALAMLNQVLESRRILNDEDDSNDATARKGISRLKAENINATVARRILDATLSDNQFAATLEEFWTNHFNVDISKVSQMHFPTYLDKIRALSTSNFSDLLLATSKSGQMLLYLNNNENLYDPKKPNNGINENYGREVMELHTLIKPANVLGPRKTIVYNQSSVTSAAEILSGWSIPPEANIERYKGSFFFNASKNSPRPSPLELSGVNIVFQSGLSEGERFLRTLASDESTKRGICRKLVQKYVADNIDPVREVANACFLAWGSGDLKNIYKTIFTHPIFWSKVAYRAKEKTPYESAISILRRLGATPSWFLARTEAEANTTKSKLGEIAASIQMSGMPILKMSDPTGYSHRGKKWGILGAVGQIRNANMFPYADPNWQSRFSTSKLAIAEITPSNILKYLGMSSPKDWQPLLTAIQKPNHVAKETFPIYTSLSALLSRPGMNRK